MHRYPSWLKQEMAADIEDVHTDSTIDLLIAADGSENGRRVSTLSSSRLPKTPKGLSALVQEARRKSALSVKVRRASQHSAIRRRSKYEDTVPYSTSYENVKRSGDLEPTTTDRTKASTSSLFKEDEEDTEAPARPPRRKGPRRKRPTRKKKKNHHHRRQQHSHHRNNSNQRHRNKESTSTNSRKRVTSKVAKMLGARKSFVESSRTKNKIGRFMRLDESNGTVSKSVWGSLRGGLRRLNWVECTVMLQPEVFSFADHAEGGGGSHEFINLRSFDTIEFASEPASAGLNTFKMKLTDGDSGRRHVFRTTDRTMMRQWEVALTVARARADGVDLPREDVRVSSRGRSTSDEHAQSSSYLDLRTTSVGTRGTARTVSSSMLSEAEVDTNVDDDNDAADEGAEGKGRKDVTCVDDGDNEVLTKKISVVKSHRRPCDFSVPLEYQPSVSVASYDRPIPKILVRLSQLLRKFGGFEREGIFRITPNRTTSSEVRQRLVSAKLCDDDDDDDENSGAVASLDCDDPHVYAHLMKQFFRDLPCDIMHGLVRDVKGSLCIVDDCCFVSKSTTRPRMRDGAMRRFLKSRLDADVRSVLMWVLDFVAAIALQEAKNRMGAKGLSIVFAPNLSKFDASDPMVVLEMNRSVSELLEKLIIWRMGVRVLKTPLEKLTVEELGAHLRINARIPDSVCAKIRKNNIAGETFHVAVTSYKRFGVFPTAIDDVFSSKESKGIFDAIDAGLLG